MNLNSNATQEQKLQKRVDNLTQIVTNLNKAVAERDTEITKLTNALTMMKHHATQLEADIEALI